MNRLTPERATEILARLAEVRVLVVGDVMLDIYLRGAASRISPEAPVPVVQVTDDWRALGGAANVAANVVALGAACDLVGVTGEDAAAAQLREAVAEGGVGDGLLAVSGRPTTVKTRIMARQQQVARYDQEVDGDLDGEAAARVAERVDAMMTEADAVVLEDYDKGVLVPAVIEAVLDDARERGVPVVVDPKSRHFFDYRGATVFKPNLPELAAALRAPVLAADEAWMERTRKHLDCSHLLLTRGEEGMALMTEAREHVLVPAVARAVYDVSGAGDTVSAVVAAALGVGATMVEAAVLANHAAGIEVGKAGVATVSPEEIAASVARLQDD